MVFGKGFKYHGARLSLHVWMAHGVGMGIIEDMKDIKAMALGPIKRVEGIKCMHA